VARRRGRRGGAGSASAQVACRRDRHVASGGR
jgi:hypothetical protein